MTGLEIALAIILGGTTIISGIVTILTRRRKDLEQLEDQHQEELIELARTRKEIIGELRAEMTDMEARYQKQISDLHTEIAELRGQYHAMRNFQVREVVEGVVKGVLDGLGALE